MHPERLGQPVLAIEADGATYHSSQTARDRDRLRQEHLERLGWRFARIWSTEWARNPEAEVERVVAAYQAALRDTEDGGVTDLPTAPIEAFAPGRELERRARPRVAPVGRGGSIADYSRRELVQIVEWITSDGLLRTEEELIREAMTDLGFRKKGKRIEEALREAIRVANGRAR